MVAVSYLMIAAVFAGCAKFASTTASTPEPAEEEAHPHDAEPAPAT